ncbi:MAG: threonylcarbamoyl-AMP synthase [Candidatus Levybacteria bacterium]|nr:threonylcarbamoyl-AMP synthase [Candidatus Levybacteria bacterium]
MDHIQKAVQILKDGGIVIFPTDTAFGIGCLAGNYKSMVRLFELRQRPLTQPTPVLVSSLEMAKRYGDFSGKVISQFVEPFWPGALTLIVPAKSGENLLAQNLEHVGLRFPNHKTTQAIIEGCGAAIFGPSANFHGFPTPFAFDDLDPKLMELVDYVVPGQTNGIFKSSTIIDTTVEPMQIVRSGGVEVAL